MDARKIWINDGLDCRELLKDIFEFILKSDFNIKIKKDLCLL
jgi:hypothetical protein